MKKVNFYDISNKMLMLRVGLLMIGEMLHDVKKKYSIIIFYLLNLFYIE